MTQIGRVKELVGKRVVAKAADGSIVVGTLTFVGVSLLHQKMSVTISGHHLPGIRLKDVHEFPQSESRFDDIQRLKELGFW